MEPLIAGWFGATEVVLLLALVLILLGARSLPFFSLGSREGLDEFRRSIRDLFGSRDVKPGESPQVVQSLVVWLAQGFSVGRMPVAPGTFGSVVGLLWFAVLLSTQTLWGFFGGLVGGLIAAVVICGKAEGILQQRDPGSIVLDEICAVPICFLPWVMSEAVGKGRWPPLETFFGAKTWYITAIIFVLFRVFDILKPWPVRQSQRLPGGWGVVMDDVLAALYVCALSLIVFH